MTASLWSRIEPATDWSSLEKFSSESTALLRLWRGFMTARSFVAAVLLLLQAVGFALGLAAPPLAIALSAGYLAATLLALRYAPFQPIRGFGATWTKTIGIDLIVFTALQLMQVGNVNYTPLFALPVLMGAVLGTGLVGLGTTAAATLLLLGYASFSWLQQPGDSSPRFVQAALTGTGLFVVALLAHEMARRLTREEALAQRNRSTAQMHALVNDLVIETLSEGVLVVDLDGRVHAANPAADEILGQGLAELELPFALGAQPAWVPLAALARQTFLRRTSQSKEIPVAQAQGAAREVRVRTRLTQARGRQSESLCVMFLQDLRELEARIRTEKLAAMGRMSAAVAHEIRNPLAAITQASALLAEDLVDPAHRQLTTMVQQNAQRLARIVDDVLDVARARQQRLLPLGEVVELDTTVHRLAQEWVQHVQRQGVLLALQADESLVRFDAEHLRRILVNLLDNAAPLCRRARRLDPGQHPARCRRPRQPGDLERRRAARTGGATASVRTLLLVGEPLQRSRPVPVPRAVRTPRRHHRLPAPRAHARRSRRQRVPCHVCGRRNPADTIAAVSIPPTSTQPARILVVDDEPDLRTLYELTLLREGYRVEAAGSVAEARKQLDAERFDAVITDMRLPDGPRHGDPAAHPAGAARRALRRHDRLRLGRERGRGPEGRRLRLPHQAGRPEAVPHRGRLGGAGQRAAGRREGAAAGRRRPGRARRRTR